MGGKRINTEEFIRRARAVHGDRYDYSRTVFTRITDNVEIICPKHGSFWQKASNHIAKHYGCPKCKGEKNAERCKLTTEKFVEKSKEKHGDKYDYSKVNYINQCTPVTIICPIHGEFKQSPNNHMRGEGCYKCGIMKTKQSRSLSVQEMVEKAREIHGDYYDYSLITKSYRHVDKVPIVCPIHGLFYQTLNNHLSNEGCPSCRRSKGEVQIKNILDNNNIEYIEQYKIPCTLEDKNYCYIDFFLPSYNTYIEYNGIQHYEPVDRFGGQQIFEKQIERDKYVRSYCNEQNIKLIEISYKDNIQEKINNSLYGEG